MDDQFSRSVQCQRLPEFENALWEWVHMQEHYCRVWEWKDVPYWYNEPASVGVLASAFWKSGAIAITGYSIKRFDNLPSEVEEQESRIGFCDFYCAVDNQHFSGEGKIAFPEVWYGYPTPLSKIQRRLTRATNQLARIDLSHLRKQERKIAMVFAVPLIPKANEAHINSIVEQWLKDIQQIEHSAIASCFPTDARYLFWPPDGFYYPGVSLIIREII